MTKPVPPAPEQNDDPARAWSMRGPMIIGFTSLFVLIFGFGLWGAVASIAGAIIAPGQIEVTDNRQVVQHLDGGVVSEILVKEGDVVKAGDVLIRLDGTLLGTQLATTEGHLSENRAQRARLEAERDGAERPNYPADLLELAKSRPEVADQIEGQTKLFDARLEAYSKQLEQLSRQIDQIEAQIGGIDAQSAANAEELRLVDAELSRQGDLQKLGLAQAAAILQQKRQQADLQGTAGQLTSQRAEAAQKITEIEVQKVRLDVNRREEASDQLRQIAPDEIELTEKRRALLEQISRLEIRAPVSGVVLGLQVTTPRAVIQAAQTVLYIVPQDRPLMITAQVSPLNIDQVHPGQPVDLVFSSFSARTTPHLTGHVTVVSADSFSDKDKGTSYYRVEIDLPKSEIAKLAPRVLLPGMPVEAYIRTDDRSPLGYLTKPFTDYFNRAFRES